MDFSVLPKPLQGEVFSYLTPGELLTSLSHSSQALRTAVFLFIVRTIEYQETYLGLIRSSPTSPGRLLKVLCAADFTQSRVLSFAVSYTDGGIYGSTNLYWAQNLFEYSGATHTADGVETDVTVSGSFLGSYYPHSFYSRLHNDLEFYTFKSYTRYPNYSSCVFPSDTFLTNVPPVLGSALTPTDAKLWKNIRGPNLVQDVKKCGEGVHRVATPESDKYALVTHVGVARPIYSTCPVRTLMVFTKLSASDPELRRWYGLTTMEEVLRRTDTPVSCSLVLSGHSYVEFAATEGPLLWVQFTAFAETQVEIRLNRRRVLRHVDVLIIDGEDRKATFNSMEIGVDTTYVVFGGKTLPKETRSVVQGEDCIQ